MKYLITVILGFFVLSNYLFAQYVAPESAVYDAANNRYLITNAQGDNIVQRNMQGIVTTFVAIQGFPASPKGMVIVGNTVYVTATTRILGYDLSTANNVMNLSITGSLFLNDIESDGAGNLLISDTWGNLIWKVNIASQSFWIFSNSINLNSPNGLLLDSPRNRVLICSFIANSPIQAVSLNDSTVTTVTNTAFTNLDGLTKDSLYNIYVSSWGSQSVYKYDINFTSSTVIASSLSGPADIFYNQLSDTLVIPNFSNNTVVFMHVPPVGIKKISNTIVGDYNLSQNYPNPFNPVTNIKFDIPKASFVKLTVYGILGKEIENVVSEELNAGKYEVDWNAVNMTSGVYFYKLTANDFVSVKKMMLLK